MSRPAARAIQVALLALCCACGDRKGAVLPVARGVVLDAETAEPIADAEVLVNGRTQVVRTGGDGRFRLTLAAGTTAAHVEVAKEGYTRGLMPHAAADGGVVVRMIRSQQAGPAQAPSRYADVPAGTAAKDTALSPPVAPTTVTEFSRASKPGAGPALAPTGLFRGITPFTGTSSCPACSSSIGPYSGCCACAANCSLMGSCGFMPPPPVKYANFPTGCNCVASACASTADAIAFGSMAGPAGGGTTTGGTSTGGGTTGGAPPPPLPPPPRDPRYPPLPPSQDYSRVVGDSAGNTDVYFNYIGGGLVFADDGTPASDDVGRIRFYLKAIVAGSAAAVHLPFQFFAGDGAGGLVPLQGIVAIDISAYQDGRRLEVTPGTSDAAMAVLPPDICAFIDRAVDATYSTEPAIGAFERRGGADDQWLYYDETKRQVVFPVDHMGMWMVAKPVASSGGCVSGQLINACDGVSPVPFRPVRINGVDSAGTHAWTDQTDGTGRYCVDAPVANYWPKLDLQVPQPPLPYFVSAADINETTMCDPFPDGTAGPADCRTCQAALQRAAPEFRICTLCSLVDPLPTFHAPTQFADTCAAPPTSDPLRRTEQIPCHFCPSSTAPTTCTLSDNAPRPTFSDCAELEPSLAYGGTTKRGAPCRCRMAGQPCDYTKDTCCFVGPRNPGKPGANQGGCRPGKVDPLRGTCGRCTVTRVGGICSATNDVCCDETDPENLLVCTDGLCIPTALDPIGGGAALGH